MPRGSGPFPPSRCRLGVVTSATGAALRDILRTLAVRYPLVDVILAAAPVQVRTHRRALWPRRRVNRWAAEQEPLDAILLARGGGSVEDLWAFNDERVARRHRRVGRAGHHRRRPRDRLHHRRFCRRSALADAYRCRGPRHARSARVGCDRAWADGVGANANPGALDRSVFGDGCPDASAGPPVPLVAHRAGPSACGRPEPSRRAGDGRVSCAARASVCGANACTCRPWTRRLSCPAATPSSPSPMARWSAQWPRLRPVIRSSARGGWGVWRSRDERPMTNDE